MTPSLSPLAQSVIAFLAPLPVDAHYEQTAKLRYPSTTSSATTLTPEWGQLVEEFVAARGWRWMSASAAGISFMYVGTEEAEAYLDFLRSDRDTEGFSPAALESMREARQVLADITARNQAAHNDISIP